MFHRALLYVRSKWSSEDPRDRLVGALGKVVVELGLAVVVSALVLAGLYALDVLVAELRLFDLFPLNAVLFVGPVAFLGNRFWCRIVLDMRAVGPGEEGTRVT